MRLSYDSSERQKQIDLVPERGSQYEVEFTERDGSIGLRAEKIAGGKRTELRRTAAQDCPDGWKELAP